MLVHLYRADFVPPHWVWSYADVARPVSALDYRFSLTDERLTQQAGQRWTESREALAVLVPSVVIPPEYNVLVNPVHPDYSAVRWQGPEPFPWDRRVIEMLQAASSRLRSPAE